MNAQEIRNRYLSYLEAKGHVVIPRANLVPENDPTTLFTGSGMQPLLPYLLGEEHPQGVRLADSQTCLRAQDIEDVGDNRHTTFFEMLGNWSMGDYFKKDQIRWFFEFLVDEVGLDPSKIYATCFIGDEAHGIPKDEESAEIWQTLFKERGIDAKVVELGSADNGDKLGMQDGRIFYYDDGENWWSRGGGINKTPMGDPCGPDSEVFYDFGEEKHDEEKWGKAHPANDSGRFMEIGNQVFMQYKRTKDGFEPLPKQNVDFGGGLERIAAAKINSDDVFRISLLWPIVEKLEELSGKKYEDHTESMRVIADHLRAATFMGVDGVTPSNSQQGYVMRRLIRRAVRYAFDLGLETNVAEIVIPVIADMYHDDFPEVAVRRDEVLATMIKEEKVFRQTLRAGEKMLKKIAHDSSDTELQGSDVFKLYDTYGYPKELSVEQAEKMGIVVSSSWEKDFETALTEQRNRSKTAAKGQFAGGLGGSDLIHKKYHTATHLMYQALRVTLGDHVVQHGSNITEERLRFDFSHGEKMTSEQIADVERIVNEQIAAALPVSWQEYPLEEARARGVLGQFGDRYGDVVKVYTMGKDGQKPFSFEICGGPHVDNTKQLKEGDKHFKIMKEQASSAGIRRIKARLV